MLKLEEVKEEVVYDLSLQTEESRALRRELEALVRRFGIPVL